MELQANKTAYSFLVGSRFTALSDFAEWGSIKNEASQILDYQEIYFTQRCNPGWYGIFYRFCNF